MTRMTRCLVLMLLCVCIAVSVAGCGYTWRGQAGSRSEDSVLGNGSKTLRVNAVEQPTMFAWLPYVMRTELRDDIAQRGLAVWVDDGPADFTITMRINSFKVRSYGEYESNTQLYSGDLSLEFIVYNGSTNTIAWQSGTIMYSDTFENRSEEEAMREMIATAIQRGVDRMQQRF